MVILSIKQLLNYVKNILNSVYSKFLINNLIYNNPSFATINSAEVCLDIEFAKINLLILMAINSKKQTLATVNSLEVVEIVLLKIVKLYRAPTPHPRMVSPTKYLFCLINPLTHFKSVFHLCRHQVVFFTSKICEKNL